MATSLPTTRGSGGCCSATAPLDAAAAERLARALKVLADPTRLRLLSMIAAADTGEACICDLTAPVKLSQPTVSHHMKQLVDAGLVTREQRGKWAYYRVVDQALAAVGHSVAAVTAASQALAADAS